MIGLTPDCAISIDGVMVTENLRKHLVSLRVTDEAGWQNDTVEIELAGNLSLPKMGSKLSVSLGYKESGLVNMDVYVINAITMKGPPHTVLIKGHGADLGSDMKAKRTRTWRDTTVGEIVSDIGIRHGYKPAISKDLTDVKIPHMDQTDESDLHFLTRLAHAQGATTKPAANHLLFVSKNQGFSASGKALDTIVLTPEDVTSYQYTHTKRNDEHTLNIITPGNPKLKAEIPILLHGISLQIPRSWIAVQVTHALNYGGFITRLVAKNH